MNRTNPRRRREAPLHTPTDLTPEATRDLSAGLNLILTDAFALYLKTRNFHWHISGPHFRDYQMTPILPLRSSGIAEMVKVASPQSLGRREIVRSKKIIDYGLPNTGYFLELRVCMPGAQA